MKTYMRLGVHFELAENYRSEKYFEETFAGKLKYILCTQYNLCKSY
jgi:hypothetical protein